MMDIWAECRNEVSPEFISNELIRVVESQEQKATNSLVDDLEEQSILEEMLEETKPAIPDGADRIHYLLVTPFRYPPLKHGSRFGTRFEPSLFYGSHALNTAFSETAYYRFLFWLGMSDPPPSGKFITQHTVFSVEYATEMGLKLQEAPFSSFEEILINPVDYSVTQKLGGKMRASGIEAFEFKSARDEAHGLNAALFTPDALTTDMPLYQQQWICHTDSDSVSFFSTAVEGVYKYEFDSYLVNKAFPEPAI
jgi:hypothetical protein